VADRLIGQTAATFRTEEQQIRISASFVLRLFARRVFCASRFAVRQELTASRADASSQHVRMVQRLPTGPHEQRALLPGAGSRPGEGRQGDAAPRGGDRFQPSRIADAAKATIAHTASAGGKHGFASRHKSVGRVSVSVTRHLPARVDDGSGGLRFANPPYKLPPRRLLPRRFLFAAFHFKPERAAREAGGVEIALGADSLEVQHGAQAVRRRF
jgi:hypothetical protein